MRIRMKVEVSGTRGSAHWPPRGATLEVSDQEGADLCRGGLAEPLVDLERAEKAVVDEQGVELRTGGGEEVVDPAHATVPTTTRRPLRQPRTEA